MKGSRSGSHWLISKMSCRNCYGLSVLIVCCIFIIFSTRWFKLSNLQSSNHATEYRKSEDDEQMRYELSSMRESLRSLRSLLEDVSCETKGIGARGGFCLKTDNINVGYNYMWDMKLCGHLEEGIFKDQDVGDLGAGLGWYGMYWTRRLKPGFRFGKELEEQHFYNNTEVMNLMRTPKILRSWKGYDGAGNVELATNGFVKYLDLSEVQNLGIKFDWVFSIEVGEHIPQQFETVFVENLIRHACKGIVLSWAVVGQGGHFHVNNHDNDYVKKLLKGYGFENLLEEENKIREDLSLGHLKNTIMIFKRKNIINHPNCPQH